MAELEAANAGAIETFLKQHGIAVVDCYADWCGPCKHIAPYVHQKSKQTGIALVKVNVDTAPELASTYKIQAMPTFLVIKGTHNNVIGNIVGGGQGNVDKIFDLAIKNK